MHELWIQENKVNIDDLLTVQASPPAQRCAAEYQQHGKGH